MGPGSPWTHICESLEPKGGHVTERWGGAPGSEGAEKSGVSVEARPEMDNEREEGHGPVGHTPLAWNSAQHGGKSTVFKIQQTWV